MSRPPVEVADILRAQSSRFLSKYQSNFGYQKLKAFRAIQNCRTAALGGHIDACQGCGLKRLYRRKKLGCAGPATVFSERKQFTKLVGRLRRRDWVVYSKPAFGGPVQVLRYLGRYTHRVAISNHRLLAFDGERVTFRWRDYAHGNKSRVMTLDAIEFLRRFFLHILPRGFVRIRHFGFLANRFRADRLALCRQLLACATAEPAATSPTVASPYHCPRCGGPMITLKRLTFQELSSPCTFFDSS